ncbi:hypothetical protein SDRG_13146 [Saprolegnia diclina VS20]|uniref:Fungal lipase-type domain-containing protein n=1 Tax=Saprolegnia diclina (strain VS20) TaxID=1156394 RepID=T0Q6M5_SAPDV|nr:hypothetical protein SDRG_13146 [Saprolegnia diclina VS20]EQC29115.1 hypothetical protein SDRG_13146 [Saprolegnia diclina VS20]|eukprot:XP_008617450.1 hypothetical protein SDRG_13146 [Saprolegnia diclina VS20]
MLGRASIWLVALAGVAQAATKELTDTCSGGGAFGLYRRESGCAIGNCDCFPIIYECDGRLADGMGQCALSRVGWSLILLAFAINLIVPAVFLVSHNIMELAKDKAVSSNSDEHVPNAMDQSKESHGQFYIDLRQFRTSVPDTALGLRAEPKIFLETMSKRWVQVVCYWLVLASLGCFALLVPPISMDETSFPLVRQNTTEINATAYTIASSSTNDLPGSTRFLSLQGDFCGVANDALPTQGAFTLSLAYNITFAMDGVVLFDQINGFKALNCVCDHGSCALRKVEEGAMGALPLVYFPWYQDAWHPFKNGTEEHTFSVAASFSFASHDLIPFMRLRPVAHLLFLSHHAFMERVLDIVNLCVFLLDMGVLLTYAVKVRSAPWLPERRVVYVMCGVNLLASCPMLYLSEYLDLSESFQAMLYASEGVFALSCGLWLLAFLFLLDMQRTRTFGARFFVGKFVLGTSVLSLYLYTYLYAADQYLSLLNFGLAIFCSTIYMGLMVDVRNNLRAHAYAETRPEQLTARLLYVIGLTVMYVFFFVALFADPLPTVSPFVPKTVILTDLAVQLILRTATWVLAVLFLPPTKTTDRHHHVYYTRARTKLPRLTSSQRDFTLAHLKQVVGGRYNRSLSLDDGYLEWRAPDAFVIETACALYNQSIAIYEEPDFDTEKGCYVVASDAHWTQDGLTLVQHFYDAMTDTYGWVLAGDKRVVVVFRGTLSAANALTDLQVHMTRPAFGVDDDDGSMVHAGFHYAYMTVRDTIRSIVQTAMASMPECQLYVTGHSLGGALATLMAYDVVTDNRWRLMEDIVVYTYGSPRVGNHKFAAAFKRVVTNCYRVCADGDAIVGTPKRSLAALCFAHLAYKHVGDNVLLSTRARGTFLINPNIVERAFISRLRVNAIAHLGPAYMNLLENGTNFTKKTKYVSARNFDEATPLLYDAI